LLRRLYDWTLGLAGHRHALAALAAVSFIESSVFPIPPDLLVIPMVLAARRRAWLIAAVCTAASVAGGMLGYAIGYFLFEMLGRPILDLYGGADRWFAEFQQKFNDWGFWWVAFAGFTPFPYKVITITSGVTNLDVVTFTLASALSRGARFFLEAALLWRYGEAIRIFVEKRLALLSFLFFFLLFGGFVLVRYLL